MRNDGWPAAIVALVLGCGPQAGTGDGGGEGDGDGSEGPDASTSTSSTTNDTNPPPDTLDLGGGGDTSSEGPCVCAVEIGENDWESCGFESSCALPMPCPRVTVTCPRPGADFYECGPEYVYDEEAIRCALEVLRDDTPAHLLLDGTEDYGIYTGQAEHEIFVEGDRVLSYTRCMATDVGNEGWAKLAQSAAADHWSGCLDLDIPREMYECLWAGIASTADAPACG